MQSHEGTRVAERMNCRGARRVYLVSRVKPRLFALLPRDRVGAIMGLGQRGN
jgi:hypothetical protein